MTTTDWEFRRPERLPLPSPFEEAIPFWEALKEGELRLQKCAGCGAVHHPPRTMCDNCRSFDFEWMPVSGQGAVYSFIVTRQPIHPALVDHTPFATVQVQLEEGQILTSNLIDVAPDDIEIGMPVQLAIQQVNDDVALPYFRRA